MKRRKKTRSHEPAKPGTSHDSQYARKRKWLDKHGLWGWEVFEPKPWKTTK